jgi:FkbM family methyltransferase
MSITNAIRRKLIELSGYFIYKKSDLPVGTDFEIDIKQKLNITPKVIFDVGANYGQTANEYNQLFPESTIYSLEPFYATFNKLIANTRHNPHIKAFPIGLSDEEGTIEVAYFIDESKSQINSLKHSEGDQVETVKTRTLDSFCIEHSISYIDLLKIDTEGYELNVLKGGAQMLEQNKIKLILCEVGLSPLNTHNSSLTQVVEYLFQYNYAIYGIYDTNNTFYQQGISYSNVLFIKL